jgi:hypothetical protein
MKNSLTHLKIFTILLLILFAGNAFSQSQIADLALTQSERDSILKDYDSFFPIWGRQAIEKGFDIPYAYGANIIYFYMNQGINLDNFGLSFQDNPLNRIDWITFKDTKTVVNTVNARFDFWLFPFLNLYGLLGEGWSTTTVNPTLKLPGKEIPFHSEVKQSGIYYGFGLTGAVGIKRNWLSLDVNWTWTDLELLEKPVPARVLGLRYGRTVKLSHKRRMAFWVGAMHQKFQTETKGTIYLKDALPGDVIDDIIDIPNQPGFGDLPQWQQDFINELIDKIENKWNSAKINYGMDKGPEAPWNLIVGMNYEHTKAWQFRVEAGLIVRYSLLLNVNYRF